MSSLSVSVLCPNGRRQIVKVTPNSSNLVILEDACKKQGLKPEDYGLKHYNHLLDLSSTVRYSNLTNNAQLELVKVTKARQEGLVSLGLQLESGERLVQDFPPSTSLWEVINHWEQTKSISLVDSSSGDLLPVCVYMRSEVVGVPALQQTTLRSLGLTNGKAIVRLNFRAKESMNIQAYVEAPLMKTVRPVEINKPAAKSSETSPSGSPKRSSVRATIGHTLNEAKELLSRQAAEHKMVMEVDEEQPGSSLKRPSSRKSTPEPSRPTSTVAKLGGRNLVERYCDTVVELGERHALLFCLDSMNIPPFEDVPDDFYDLTVEDMKYLMADLQRRRKALEEMPLQTRALKEAEQKAKMIKYKEAIIRVLFPERLVVQGCFKSVETVGDIMDFLRKYISESVKDFHLFTAPPKTILQPEDSLYAAALIPKANVHFGCTYVEGHPLHEDILKRLECSRETSQNTSGHFHASPRSHRTRSTAGATPCEDSYSANASHSMEEPRTNYSNAPSQKVPLWFKMNK